MSISLSICSLTLQNSFPKIALGRLATAPCLIEPFRNPPTRTEVRNCLLKLFLVHADMQRQARREEMRVLEADLPHLWILSPSASKALLDGFAAQPRDTWLSGNYFLSESLRTAIIAIDQLPCTDETLWLRLLGNGQTQQQAISEVLNFPTDDPHRVRILELLVNWKISLDVTGAFEQEEQSLMETLSQAYLEWEQQTEQRGIERGIERGRQEGMERERSLILRQLTRQVGEVPAVRSQIEALAIPQLEALGEALLEFSSLSDLEAWLIEM